MAYGSANVPGKLLPGDIGAAPAGHTHTAADVGASPVGHTHTAEDVGAAAANHTHTAAAVGAATADHTHTPQSIGAAEASHTHTGYAAANHTHTAAAVGAATVCRITIPKGRMRGDIDGDGRITEQDVTLVQKNLSGTVSLEGIQKWCADIDGSGEINGVDGVLFSQYVSEKTTLDLTDYYGNWTYHAGINDYWTADVPVPGLTQAMSAVVVIPGTWWRGMFSRAEIIPGEKIRIYSATPPNVDIAALVVHKKGNGSAEICADLSLDYMAPANHTHTAAAVGAAAANHTHTGYAAASHEHSGYVPASRKINNMALSQDIILGASSVGAAPVDHTHSGTAIRLEDIPDSVCIPGAIVGPAVYANMGNGASPELRYTDFVHLRDVMGVAAANHTHTGYVPVSRTINGKQLSQDIILSASSVSSIPIDHRGIANGVASLDATGKVPDSQLPSRAAYEAGTIAPKDRTKLWINTNPGAEGLLYHNGSTWVRIPMS